MSSMLKHLFMPRGVAKEQWSPEDDIAEREAVIQFKSFIEDFSFQGIDVSILKDSVVLFSNHLKSPPLIRDFKSLFNKDLRHPILVYIKQSNCFIVFHKNPDNTNNNNNNNQNNDKIIIISIIQIYPQFDEFSVSSLKSRVVIPIVNYQVPIKNIMEDGFIENLIYLRDLSAPLPISVHKSTKSGQVTSKVKYSPHVNALTEWLLPTVSSGTISDNLNSFYKSVPTQIYKFKNGSWRRSPMWIGFKASVQFILSLSHDQLEFKNIHKLLMLYFYSNIAFVHHQIPNKPSLDINDSHERLLKLSNRLRKLESQNQKDQRNELSNLFDMTRKYSESIITTISQDIKNEWVEICRNEEIHNDIKEDISDIFTIDFKDSGHTFHKLVTLREHIKSLITSYNSSNTDKSKTLSNNINLLPQNWKSESKPIETLLRGIRSWLEDYSPEHYKTTTDTNMLLATIEEVVAKLFWTCRDKIMEFKEISDYLFTILDKYYNIAKTLYLNNPKLTSKMILTVFALVALLDHVPGASFSQENANIYYQHPPLINLEIFSRLLLEYDYEYILLEEIEIYFTNRFEISNKKLDTIFSIKSTGFPYLWARSNLQDELEDLRESDKEKRELKVMQFEKETLKILKKLNDLDNEHKALSDQDQDYHKKLRSINKRRKKQKTFKIPIHEDCLPENEIEALIVVYDRFTPIDLSIITDAYALVSQMVSKHTEYDSATEFWNQDPNSTKRVALVSKSKSFTSPNQKIYSNVVTSFIRVSGLQVSEFIVKSNNLVISEVSSWSIVDMCTYQIPKSLPSHSLQWMLNVDDVPENKVIGSQIKCPKSMTVDQYVEFGIMRAGGNLQIRNIVRAIEGQRLDFNNMEVYLLLSQIIYQIGPPLSSSSSEDPELRPWKYDVNDKDVNIVIVHAINKHLQTIEANWDTSYILLIYIKTLSTFSNLLNLLSKDSSYKTELHKSLIKCREIAQKWMKSLKSQIAEVLKNNNVSESQKLKTNLVYASICSILTYDCDQAENHTTNGLIDYIRSLVYLTSNTIISHQKISLIIPEDNNVIFYQLIDDVFRISLKKYSQINDFLQNDNESTNKVLTKFTKEYWASSEGGIFSKWQKLEGDNNPFWWTKFYRNQSGTQLQYIQINIQNGSFLIDGSPISRLPSDIESSDEYQRVFGLSIFEIQSSGYQRWKTVNSHLGRYYEFFYHTNNKNSNKKQIGIIEHNNKEIRLLLNFEYFKKSLSNTFTNEYSHWVDTVNNQIEFREISFLNYDKPHKYHIDLNTGELISTESKDIRLLDINSKPFKYIYSIFQRIELPLNINIFISSVDVRIQLPRYNLDFTLNQIKKVISSSQYPDYHVSPSQYLGTLIGFNSTLILDHEKGNSYLQRKLLVPNASLARTDAVDEQELENEQHQITYSKLDSLRKPELFCYDVDDEFSLLRCNDILPQLFLSYLHGMTSSTQIDPFTGITGVESSLQALKHYQSNIPFTDECRDMLKEISFISPKRLSFPPNALKGVLQTVEWNKFVHPSIASESFSILCKHIQKRNKELRFLYQTKVQEDKPKTKIQKNSMTLMTCHYRISIRNLSNLSKIPLDILPFENNEILIPLPKFVDMSKEISNLSCRFKQEIIPKSSLKPQTASDILLSRSSNTQIIKGVSEILLENSNSFFSLTTSPEDSYLTLVDLAKSVQAGKFSKSRFNFICTYLHWLWCSSGSNVFNYFESLISIANYDNSVQGLTIPSIPKEQEWLLPLETYNKTLIHNLFEKYLNFDESRTKEYKQQFVSTLWSHFEVEENHRWGKYPYCGKAPKSVLQFADHPHINPELNPLINELISQWIKNRDFKCFINQLDDCLDRISSQSLTKQMKKLNLNQNHQQSISFKSSLIPIHNSLNLKSFQTLDKVKSEYPKYFIDLFDNGYDKEIEDLFQKCLVKKSTQSEISEKSQNFLENLQIKKTYLGKHIKKDLEASLKSLQIKFEKSPQYILDSSFLSNLLIIEEKITQKSKEIWNLILKSFSSQDFITRVFKMVNLTNFSTKYFIFNYFKDLIIQQEQQQQPTSYDPLFKCIGSYILLRSYLGKVKRCQSRSEKEEIIKELETTRLNRNWLPKDYPEWLLFELEQGIMIRDIQAKIAMDLINTKDNICTQIQMGEGKTSVILPIMCLALSIRSMTVRINVLPSLLETSRDDLIRRMGGVLNRKLYIFPYQRDKGYLSNEHSNIMLSQLEECKRNNGIILSTPEYNLSFLLKWKLKFELDSKEMKRVLDWYQLNIFEILDESDELLSHRYQLIYPLGGKLPLDGDTQRWTIIQNILLELKKNISTLIKDKRSTIDVQFNNGFPTSFPNIVILDQDSGKELLDKLLHILIDKKVMDSEKKQILQDISSKGEYDRSKFYKLSEMDSSFKNLTLMYRGLFVYGILLHCFSKIPTKDFGFSNNDRTRLAVPYRAKDTPSERAEYGHPDVLLVLTHIIYYNQGLTESQFIQSLEYLLTREKYQSREIYSSWVLDEITIPERFKSVQCIILSNSTLLTELYDIFKFNMLVINFYLSTIVLPFETKTFPEKIFANSWDITTKKDHPTTGFSGTNDTSCLLPLTIEQKDLPELKYTNFEVINYILSQNIKNPVEIVNKNIILDQIISNQHKAKVLIDTGALMIGKSNYQVAKYWLKQSDPKLIDGALFFENNILTAIDRNDKKYRFYLSPFVQQLDRVVVYLDDYHTRGVDIKFPVGTHACVTVGQTLTKEKLLQGILRLRKFGKGQTISFYISDQLPLCINKTSVPTVESILNFVTGNTITSISNSFQSWSLQGILHSKSIDGSKIFNDYPDIFRSLSSFPEQIKLEDMYGPHYKKSELSSVIDQSVLVSNKKFHKIIEPIDDEDLKLALKTKIRKFNGKIQKKVEKLVSDIDVYSNMMDEEQEREFEIEEERERETQLPGQREEKPSVFRDDFYNLLKNPDEPIPPNNKPFLPLHAMYKNTTLENYFEHSAWDFNLNISHDFYNTVYPRVNPKNSAQELPENLDYYLKIPNFILVLWRKPNPIIIFISQYEANILLPLIREQKPKEIVGSLHQVSQIATRGQNDLLRSLFTPLPERVKDLSSINLILNQITILIGSKFFPSKHLSEIYSLLGVLELDNTSIQNLVDKYPKSISSTGFVRDRSMRPPEIPEVVWNKIKSSKFEKEPFEFIQRNLSVRRIHSIIYSEIELILKLN